MWTLSLHFGNLKPRAQKHPHLTTPTSSTSSVASLAYCVIVIGRKLFGRGRGSSRMIRFVEAIWIITSEGWNITNQTRGWCFQYVTHRVLRVDLGKDFNNYPLVIMNKSIAIQFVSTIFVSVHFPDVYNTSGCNDWIMITFNVRVKWVESISLRQIPEILRES